MGRHSTWQPDWNYLDKDLREGYNASRRRWELQIQKLRHWFVRDADPCWKMDEPFQGVHNFRAAVVDAVVATYAYRFEVDGAGGSALALDEKFGGMRLTTGGSNGNSVEWGTGDTTGFKHPLNLDQDIFWHIHIRFPEASDLTNSFFLGGFYYDADNYCCFRYDSAVDNHLRWVTRSGGSETIEDLGVLSPNTWIGMYGELSSTAIYIALDEETELIEQTTDLPTTDLAYYATLQTNENVAKKFDMRHFTIIQNEDL